ncbi:hypothetical protein PR202_ga19901 [Eleusine coracana subsp. coracana]|uniref:F-box domain-containing protein n=1 Tax=Eleusine coracana subsp. coracana TaxID=191504 RepID=A0AAV5CWT9_ELECO|nr:hypothetical protein PR202_ga19901 [Eleusine coracana subsp. coracana]
MIRKIELSSLPDDILMHILDKLELLSDAVRTCVLSKRWSHLLGLHSGIVLDISRYLPEVHSIGCTLQELVRANLLVVEATKRILSHESRHTIMNLSIRFCLRDESIDIVRSVGKAMENREVLAAEVIMEQGLLYLLQIWIQPEALILLASKMQKLQIIRLRCIHEECDLTWTMFFLEAASLLKELHVQVSCF